MENPGSWSFDKRVGLDTIIAFILLLGTGIAYVMSQDQRTTKTEQRLEFAEKTDVRHDAEIRELKTDINTKLDRLEQKLDRLVERQTER